MRVQAIVKRILLQRLGDKRSLALLFIAPLLILGLMYLLLQVPSDVSYRVGINNQTSDQSLVKLLEKTDKLELVPVSNQTRATLNDQNLAAAITIKPNEFDVVYSNLSTSKSQAISMLLNQTIQKMQLKTSGQLQNQAQLSQKIKVNSYYLYGDSKLNPFDNLAPILVGFFVFFFVFLISGISLVNERSSGTLMRMLVSPVKRSEIVTAYTMAYGFLAVIQTLLVLIWTHFVLGMTVVGNFGWVIVINLLIAMIALLIGLLLSSLAKTEFQFIQFLPIAVVPQFLFSGIINVDTMSQPLQWVAHVMPLYYAVDALQKVVKQGMGAGQIGIDLAVLFAVVILLYLLNVLALKRLRRT